MFTFVDCFLNLTCHVFCTYVVSACAGLFSKFLKIYIHGQILFFFFFVFSSIFLITRSTRTFRCHCLVPSRLSFDVRAKEGGKETTGETALRPPSVPFPWSLAVHHQLLAFRARLCHAKNEAPEEEASVVIVNDPQFSDLPFFWQ